MSQSRAALSKPEQYGWVHVIAVAYVALVGAYACFAWVGDGEPFRAALCAGAQALAIVCAVLARRAFTGEMPGMGVLMVLFTLGCAFWAALGIKHAWEANGSDINLLMVAFLAALEPILFLAAEHIKEGREALREAHQRDYAEQQAELALIRSRQGLGPRLATTGGVALASLPAAANAGELALRWPEPNQPPSIVSTNTGYPSAREHAVALKRANPKLTEREAAQAVGGSRSTVGRWWRDAGLTASAVA